MKACVVFITAPSKKEGRKIAAGLVKEKLAACVNVVAQVESFYRWQGKIENAAEVLLVVKTLSSRLNPLTEWVRRHHSYSVPEIISMKIEKGERRYLNWIKESLP